MSSASEKLRAALAARQAEQEALLKQIAEAEEEEERQRVEEERKAREEAERVAKEAEERRKAEEEAKKAAEEEARKAAAEAEAKRKELEAAELARADAEVRAEAAQALSAQSGVPGAEDIEMGGPEGGEGAKEPETKSGDGGRKMRSRRVVPKTEWVQCRKCKERDLVCAPQAGSKASACTACATRKEACVRTDDEEAGPPSEATTASRKRRRTGTVTAADTPVAGPSRGAGRRMRTPEYWPENNALLRETNTLLRQLVHGVARQEGALQLLASGLNRLVRTLDPGAESRSGGVSGDQADEEDGGQEGEEGPEVKGDGEEDVEEHEESEVVSGKGKGVAK